MTVQHAVPYHPTMIMHPGAGGPPPGGSNGPPHMYEGPGAAGNGVPPAPSTNSSTGPGSGSSNGVSTNN